MFHIQIDKNVPLSDVTAIPKTSMSLILTDEHPQVVLRYNNSPFITNIPIQDNIAVTNCGGLINGDYKDIQFYIDDSLYTDIDLFMNTLQDHKIMATMIHI